MCYSMVMIAFASITQLRKSLARLTIFQDEGWINRGPRYLSWSQGQANENEQWCVTAWASAHANM